MKSQHPLGQKWNAQQYDKKLAFVSQLGSELIELLGPLEEKRILDLGCGTGDLAQRLAEGGAFVYGIDASPEMIARARNKYPGLRFETTDGQLFALEEKVDAVFSNAALHWMKRPADVIGCVMAALKPGGRFVAEFGGAGNVAAIRHSIRDALAAQGIDAAARCPWYFPTVGEYASLLGQAGFIVRMALHWDRPTQLADGENGFRDWLDAFAGAFFAGMSETAKREAYANAEEAARSKLFDAASGVWTADYKRLRIVAEKPA
ncbi:class I SAM-dependent methyltransferase [Paenibacillus sp. MBLB4367]|uniref:class I SAM-dependent methyltransferase n=1 Tax=Paenibacillus sp. MBLB4367 TaxID=3384767 RepID=UPI003908249A